MHHHRLHLASALGVLLAAAACSPAPAATTPTPTRTGPAPSIDAAISVEELRRDLYAFADDSMRGREAGTEDGRRAAIFLAERLRAAGVEPAGDSGYFQRVPLQRESFGPETRFSVNDGGRTVDLPLERAIAPLLNLGEGAPLPKHNATGELVFVGWLADPAAAQRDLQGLDLRGKVAVVLHGAPPGADSATRARLEGQEMLSARLGTLIQRGPAAVILLMHDGTEELYSKFAPELMRSMHPPTQSVAQSDAERPLPMILLGLAREAEVLLPANWRTAKPQALGRQFTGRVVVQRESVPAYNVVGLVRGSDPRFNRTYVAYGAHLDHVGVQSGMRPDSISNGADDDGSGSIALLAIARAFQGASEKPRRSMLFVWHTAEEKGLYGSARFVDRPTVPIDSIVAQINADMIGRNGAATETGRVPSDAPTRLFVVGPGAAPNNQSRTLGAILDSVNARQPRPFTFDREWDTPTHPERIYFRSDHYNYARKGIPIVFLTTGLHVDYHKVSDSPDKIDYEKMARVTRLMLDLGIAVGNRTTRPR